MTSRQFAKRTADNHGFDLSHPKYPRVMEDASLNGFDSPNNASDESQLGTTPKGTGAIRLVAEEDDDDYSFPVLQNSQQKAKGTRSQKFRRGSAKFIDPDDSREVVRTNMAKQMQSLVNAIQVVENGIEIQRRELKDFNDGENNLMDQILANLSVVRDNQQVVFDQNADIIALMLEERKRNQEFQANLVDYLALNQGAVIEPLSDAMPGLEKLIRKEAKKTNELSWRDKQVMREELTTPWNAYYGNYLIKMDGQRVKLNEYSRMDVRDEIVRRQDSKWQEPMYHGYGLKKAIRLFLGKRFAYVDQPPLNGLAISQFLWDIESLYFNEHHMPNIADENAPIKHEKTPANKTAITDEERDLFVQILLFCGAFIFVKKPDAPMGNKNIWIEYARAARNSLPTRSDQQKKYNEHRPGGSNTTKYMPARFTPLLKRDWTNLDWQEEIEREYDKVWNGNIDQDEARAQFSGAQESA